MEPLIKPDSWVLFTLGKQSARMGQVVGAYWSADDKGDRWTYAITNPFGNQPYIIPENDIYKWLDGDGWKAAREE